MDEELYCYMLRSPHLHESPPCPNTSPGHVNWRDGDLELSRFRGNSEGSAVMDLTLPKLKKPRKLTDYFTLAMTRPTRMPYFLQQYKPQEPVTKAHEDGTGGGSNRESPAVISGPSTSHGNQCKRSVVNKTYTLAQKLGRFYSMFVPILKLRLHVILRHLGQPSRDGKILTGNPSTRRRAVRKRGRTKLDLAAFSHTVRTDELSRKKSLFVAQGHTNDNSL